MNKIANFFWTADPIAQMQYEYDQAVDQLKDGRQGLEQYRALVERVGRQAAGNRQQVQSLEAKVKAYLSAGDRETAARYALELQKAKTETTENEQQLKMHEEAYQNNVTKVLHATKKLGEVREKIQKYDAELKMSRAEAEMAELAHQLQLQRDHRLWPSRADNPGQNQLESGQSAGGGRSIGRRARGHQGGAGDGEVDGRSGAARV